MGYKAKNNATSTLAVGISSSATSLAVETAHGDRFPVITAPDYTYVTLENAAGAREVVKVTARTLGADVMTIVRGQDGTTAVAWNAADIVDLRLTAQVVQEAFDNMEALDLKADLASPVLTGVPVAPTAPLGTDTTQVATTAFVQDAITDLGSMSTQDANAVAITGGAITNTTVNGVVVGSNAAGARTVSVDAPSGGVDGDVWYRI